MEAFERLSIAMGLQPRATTNLDDRPAVGNKGGTRTVSPDVARDLARVARSLASALDAAADEAESEPRFSEEDIEAIRSEMGVWQSEFVDCIEGRLRKLRKPRAS